jgi:hypothetical protein
MWRWRVEVVEVGKMRMQHAQNAGPACRVQVERNGGIGVIELLLDEFERRGCDGTRRKSSRAGRVYQVAVTMVKGRQIRGANWAAWPCGA